MVFLTLAALLAIAVMVERVGRYPPAFALMLTVSGSLLLLYLAALTGLLWWAAVLIHGVGIALAGYVVLGLVREPRRLTVPPPYGLLVLFCGLFWLVHHDNQFFFYDEFGHWGIFLRDMLADDAFWGADTNARHPRYVPGSTLWQYFFSVLARPTDGVAFFGQFVLLITPLMILWHGLRWRDAGWILGLAALCLAVLANFGVGVASLYVDHVLGTWFAGIVVAGLFLGEVRGRRLMIFALPLTVLALVKQVGIPIAITAAGILAAIGLRRGWSGRASLSTGVVRAGLVFFVLLLPAVIATTLWHWDRERHGVPSGDGSIATFAAGAIAGDGDMPEAQAAEISRRFLDVFINQQISRDETSAQFNAFSYPLRELFQDRFRLTTFWLLCLFALWQAVAVVYFLRGDARWDWAIAGAGVVVATVAYLALLHKGYVRASGEYGLKLSSYIRYVNTLALPMVVLAFSVLVPGGRGHAPEKSPPILGGRVTTGALGFAIGLIALLLLERPYLGPIVRDNPVLPLRAQTASITGAVSGVAGRQRVWVYLPNDQPNEFIGRFLQFQLSPTPATVERSGTFMAQDRDAMLAYWGRYQYVWFPVSIEGLDEALREIAGDVRPGQLFRVIRDESTVSIAPVEIQF